MNSRRSASSRSSAAHNVAVKEIGDDIVFLRRLERGGTDRSYGVQVARLAGLPREVIERARQILRGLEGADMDLGQLPGRRGRLPASADLSQLSLFQAPDSPVLEALRAAVPETMTPLEALALVSELKQQLEET